MKIGVLGRNGFIGSELTKKLSKFFTVYPYPRKDLKIMYLFNSPSSNLLFDENIDYCFKETIDGFLEAVKFCRDYNIKLIYPSSATVYKKNTSYAICKHILEQIHSSYGGNIIGLRIFAGYGVGEEHKGDYASIIYKFCKDIINGKRPVIYGDGEQTRDFIYIDDIVDNIIASSFCFSSGIYDIGTGVDTSFNQIIGMINKELKTNISPVYKPLPEYYVNETICKFASPYKISVKEGIKKICKHLKSLT